MAACAGFGSIILTVLRLCRHLLQGFVIVSEYLHFNGLRGTHQVAQEVGDTLPEAVGHQRNGLRYFPAQVADDFGGTCLPVRFQLNQIVAEIARTSLEGHAESRAARVSLHIGMRHDNAFHLTTKAVGLLDVRSCWRVIVEHDSPFIQIGKKARRELGRGIPAAQT